MAKSDYTDKQLEEIEAAFRKDGTMPPDSVFDPRATPRFRRVTTEEAESGVAEATRPVAAAEPPATPGGAS